MSGNVSASINPFSAGCDSPVPEKLHPLGRACGLLMSIQQEEDCQIAQVVNRFCERRIVLPLDYDLSQYVGQDIVMMGLGDRTLIRRAGKCIDPQ